jgi:Flagellar hook-length control protein FliK
LRQNGPDPGSSAAGSDGEGLTTGASGASEAPRLPGATPTPTPSATPAPGGDPSPARASAPAAHSGDAGEPSTSAAASGLPPTPATGGQANELHATIHRATPPGVAAHHDAGASEPASASATGQSPTDLGSLAGLPEGGPAATTPPAGGPQAPLLSYGVGLRETIETVHATIELAARQGLSQARIALQPAELGEIRIHLAQTEQGLVARVTAETPAAAQALAGGHAELRQSLSSIGLSLAHLDIGHLGQQAAPGGQHSAGGGRQNSAGQASGIAPASRAGALAEPEDPEAAALTAAESEPHALALSGGALVDVLV